MMVQLITELKDYKHFKVKSYNIILLDGKWLCYCSMKYGRKLNSNCKHIKQCKQYLIKTF